MSDPVTGSMLWMRNIGMVFSGVRVLEAVNLDVRAGEVHVLAGENGAGKSTLMKILCGVYTPTEGSVELDGKTVKFRSPRQATDHGVRMIHQELSLVPALNAVDNAFLGQELSRAGWVRRVAEEVRLKGWLTRLGVDVDLRRPVEEYPVSVQQMIEVAKALTFDARILIMDEPTSALNRPEVEQLFAVVSDLKAHGCGIVYITHKMEEIYRIADRITVLRDGKYVGTARAADLRQAELVKWMVGREVKEHFTQRTAHAGDEVLRVQRLSVADPTGRQAWRVQNVSFALKKGEVVGLAGLEGAGNHEVMEALFDTTSGRVKGAVWLEGKELNRRQPRMSIREGLAYLTSDRKGKGLVLDMSITRNTTLASLKRFSPWLVLRNRAETEAARRHGKAFRTRYATLEQPVKELSGGNQQKVVLAKWLETRPKVLLLDEPTRGVDVGAKREIYELIDRWTAEGIGIVLITSEMPELLALADRILVMHRGEVTAVMKRGEATQERVLAAAMGQGDEA